MIMVRTSTGLCWAALTKTRTQPSDEIDAALNRLTWDMVRSVLTSGVNPGKNFLRHSPYPA
jgi:hypothetical protein